MNPCNRCPRNGTNDCPCPALNLKMRLKFCPFLDEMRSLRQAAINILQKKAIKSQTITFCNNDLKNLFNRTAPILLN